MGRPIGQCYKNYIEDESQEELGHGIKEELKKRGIKWNRTENVVWNREVRTKMGKSKGLKGNECLPQY